jgi:threonine aldolase
MEAIARANRAPAHSYGADLWTDGLQKTLSDWFETQVRAFPLVSGTAANSLALASVCPGFGGVVAHAQSHIQCDECGAPEFFTGGAKLILADGEGAKLTPNSVKGALVPYQASFHQVQPRALSLTQATEMGRSYTPDEIGALTETARAHQLVVHMDGARFANALAFLGCAPADISWRAGVDILCLGATKNGAMAAECLIYFKPSQAENLPFLMKRAGHTLSKLRFVSAQLEAFITTGVWQRNALHANRLARKIGNAASALLLQPVEANEVFLRLSAAERSSLRAAGAEFYDWGVESARFVTAWNSDEAEVDRLIAILPSKL